MLMENIPEQQCIDKHRQEDENVEIMKPMDKEEVRMSSEDMLTKFKNWLKYIFIINYLY